MSKEQLINAWTAFNAVILISFIVAWPLSVFTFAKHEPKTVLSLSWAAMVVSAMGNLIATLILRQVDEDVDTTGAKPTEWERRKGSIGRAR